MEPYFFEGDKLYYRSDLLPTLGNCIVFKKGNERIVHRFLGDIGLKGDNVKRFDREFCPDDTDFILEGVITHRLFGNDLKELKSGIPVRFLSFCSQYNHAGLKLFHRFYGTLVILLGRTLRAWENRL